MATRSLNAQPSSPPPTPRITPVTQQDKSEVPGSQPKPASAEPKKPGIFYMDGYRERKMMFDFLELCYKGGPGFKYGRDPKGMNVLIEHENERIEAVTTTTKLQTASEVVGRSESALRSDKYNRRLRSASYVNYVKPIEDKYRSYVFSVAPSRPKNDAITAQIEKIKLDENVDAMVGDGLRFVETWIGFDTKALVLPPGRDSLTKDEIRKQDPEFEGNPYIVRLDPRSVADYTEEAGEITRVTIQEDVEQKGSITEAKTKRTFFREWTATSWVLYELVTNNKGEPELHLRGRGNHLFGVCPFRRVCFPFPTEDICDLNRQDFNVGSLLDEEMYQNTFSQRCISGVKPEDVKMTDRGAGNTMVLPEPDSKISIISGDPAQSKTIMDRRTEIRNAIFDLVSMNPMNKNVAESAEKKKRDLESLYTLLSKIAEVVEKAENWLLTSMGVYDKEDPEQRSKYSRQFDVYSVDDLIEQLTNLGKTSFSPPSLKRRLALALAQKVDPFGPHVEYEAEVERMFDTNPSIIESLMTMKREGAMTVDMLVTSLGISSELAADLEEIMQHPDPMGTDPAAGSDPGSNPNEVPPVPSNAGDGQSGPGDSSGSGSTGASDGGAGDTGTPTTDKAKPSGGKARGVRRGKPAR